MPNVAVIDEICRGVDAAFAADPTLAGRFALAPAANGRSTAELKTFVTDRKSHDRRYAIDETKIRNELGYRPRRNFSQGFADTLAWYLDREDWWRALVDRGKNNQIGYFWAFLQLSVRISNKTRTGR